MISSEWEREKRFIRLQKKDENRLEGLRRKVSLDFAAVSMNELEVDFDPFCRLLRGHMRVFMIENWWIKI